MIYASCPREVGLARGKRMHRCIRSGVRAALRGTKAGEEAFNSTICSRGVGGGVAGSGITILIARGEGSKEFCKFNVLHLIMRAFTRCSSVESGVKLISGYCGGDAELGG